ncbi:MAG TPA: DinB family protein [Bryobacteraceae bacterium]|nr:DinB family protein [Bryobacteraceae bacterium]
MEAALARTFLDFSAAKLRQLSSRIEACLSLLNEEQVWARGGEHENAIGNLVLHLCGNVGQWLLAGVGGAPDTRVRDREFQARGGITIPQLKELLERSIAEATALLERVPPEQLTQRITVQKHDETVLEAIYHVVEHFSMHTGQIIFATKVISGKSL